MWPQLETLAPAYPGNMKPNFELGTVVRALGTVVRAPLN
jgi:hypothetical protein